MRTTTTKTFSLVALLATAAQLVCAPAACAYRIDKYMGHPIKRAGTGMGFYAGALSYPAGSDKRAALLLAQGRWNETPGKFFFGTPLWGATKVKRYNGDSETWFTTDQGILKGRPAVCTSVNAYTIPAKIVEADIFYDNALSWSFNENRTESWVYNATSGRSPYVTATVHELGHAFGLKHVNSIYNVMGSDATHVTTNGGTYRAYVGEDAIEGQVALYGEDATGEDLSVSHFKYAFAQGEYSAHASTAIYPPGSNNQVFSEGPLTDGQPVYRVKRGQAYDAEFTYENNGVHDQTSVDMGFYISDNATITTLDRKVRSFQFSKITRGLPATWRNRVDIPADLTPGNLYYLGVIIDDDDSTAEVVETNNAGFIQIRIQ